MTEFEQIYRTYFDDVYRYMLRLSRDEHLAQDITGDTFLRALDHIDRFRGDCDMRVWLCQIAKNLYFSHRKKAGRIDSLDDPAMLQLPDGEDMPAQRIAEQEQVIRIRSLLHELPEPYREVFMWRVYAELSFAQIGQIFGKSENWACVTYHRARDKIRKRLEGEL